MAKGATINVTQVIDDGRYSGFQGWVAVWCAFLLIIEGYDIGVIGFVAPAIAPQWGVPVSSFGPVFGAGVLAMMLSGFASGPLADRFGRKVVILGAILIVGAFSLATTLATSINMLYVLRFCTGLGIGLLTPPCVALAAEYAPRRLRATAVMVAFLGLPLGTGVDGFVGAVLIPAYGWQAMFVLGGLLPLVLVPIAIFALPESIDFLVVRGDRPKTVASLLNRLGGRAAFDGSETFVISEEKLPGFPVWRLFDKGRAINTVLLWITSFCGLLVIFSLNLWLPAVLREAGVPLGAALRLAALLAWSGVVGIVVLALIAGRLRVPGTIALLFVGTAVFVLGVGLAAASVPLLAVTIICCGVCVNGARSLVYVIAATLYPTAIRSTGVGWAVGLGQFGAVVGPVLGGLLLAAQFTPKELLFSGAVPALIAASAMFILGWRLRAAEGSAPAVAVARAEVTT
jgi:AAHS family 4-hydroxybenzoate transporter-like MFS transporter